MPENEKIEKTNQIRIVTLKKYACSECGSYYLYAKKDGSRVCRKCGTVNKPPVVEGIYGNAEVSK